MKQYEYQIIEIEKLKPYEKNSRTHSTEQIKQIMDSIKAFGFTNPLLIDDDFNLIAGHGRLEAINQLNKVDFAEKPILEIPCIIVSGLSETEKKALVIADNKIALNAGWDIEVLGQELFELENANFDMSLTGFNAEELVELLGEFEDISDKEFEGIGEEEAIEPPKEAKMIKRGDLIELGRHRVLCGDSTIKEDVDKLMCGDKADMVLTDPPYGVSYEKKRNSVLGGSEFFTKIANDDLKGDDFLFFLRDLFGNVAPILKDGGSYYVFSPQGGDMEMMMMMMMRECGIPCRHQLIWVKDAPVFSMGRLDYDYKHEPILYGWKKGKGHNFYGKGEQNKSVLEYPRQENKLHPTMKPTNLLKNLILNSTKENEIIFDCCLGSGSTLLASEMVKRVCFGIEYEPIYCEVIISRYCKEVGSNKIKINGEEVEWEM